MIRVAKINLVAAWAILVLKLLTAPVGGGSCDYPLICSDKFVHFMLFFILTFFLGIFFLEFISIRFAGFKAFLLSFVYVILTEYLQKFIPDRTYDFYDIAFGVFGAFSMFLIFLYFDHRARAKRPRLLLHICCAGCGVYVGRLLSQQFNVVLYYTNSNIYSKTEYEKRLKEVKRIAKKYRIKLEVGEYNHKKWLNAIKGHEKDNEKGERCFICYEYRMKEVAKHAWENDYDYFSTTLSVSPHKIYKKIKESGEKLAKEYNVQFYDQNFKKKDGFKLASKLSRKLKLYRQDYCGCEFSKRA